MPRQINPDGGSPVGALRHRSSRDTPTSNTSPTTISGANSTRPITTSGGVGVIRGLVGTGISTRRAAVGLLAPQAQNTAASAGSKPQLALAPGQRPCAERGAVVGAGVVWIADDGRGLVIELVLPHGFHDGTMLELGIQLPGTRQRERLPRAMARPPASRRRPVISSHDEAAPS